jgi:hypothetical protein
MNVSWSLAYIRTADVAEIGAVAKIVDSYGLASELPKNSREALDAVADVRFERLIGLCEDRARLWKLAHRAVA